MAQLSLAVAALACSDPSGEANAEPSAAGADVPGLGGGGVTTTGGAGAATAGGGVGAAGASGSAAGAMDTAAGSAAGAAAASAVGGSGAATGGTSGGAGADAAGGDGEPAGDGTAETGGAAGQSTAGTGTAGGEPAGCPASATATSGETTESVTVGSLTRSYLLHVPPGYDGQTPMPVVIDFHPLGGTGSQQRNLSGWASLGDREGFITVFPDGVGNSWNVGRCCPPAMDQGVDDVAFTRAILEQLQREACIDTRRVYASGCSNGGGMSFKVACEAADVIAAVAPVDFDCVVGPTNDPSCGGCEPARPISETQFRATGDFAVSYEGGPAPIPQGMSFPGAEANFADFAAINQCTGSPEPLAGHAACQTYTSCADGAQTTLCTAQGGSHCGNYQSLAITATAWEMFQKASLH